MRAAWIDGFGGPEVLVVRESPDPAPAAGEVLLDVEIAGVNFGETQLRSGARKLIGKGAPPVILGNEVGGRVRAVGQGASADLVGKRFVARMGGTGGYADCVAIPAERLVPVPDTLDLSTAVALIAQGRTALQVMDEAGVRPGDAVLVESAAGGTGVLLLQLLKAAGASPVIGTARGAKKLELIRDLGADLAVDYSHPGWADAVRQATGGAGVHVVFESVGGSIGREAFDLLRPGKGRMIVFGFSSGEDTPIGLQEVLMRGVSVVGVGAPRAPTPAELDAYVGKALSLAAKGELRAVIGGVFPLADVQAAHRALEDRSSVGKILLATGKDADGGPRGTPELAEVGA